MNKVECIVNEYVVKDRSSINQIEDWCQKQFGSCPYTYWSPPAGYTWSMHVYTGLPRIRLLFTDEIQLTWFLTRWSQELCTK